VHAMFRSKVCEAVQVFVSARRRLGEILSAFEFLDRASLELTLSELEGVRDPLPSSVEPFYLVVETSGSNAAHDYEKLEARASLSDAPAWAADRKMLFHVFHMSVCLQCRHTEAGEGHSPRKSQRWRVQAFLEEVMEEGLVVDGTIAQDSVQVAGIWGLREGISVALKHAGAFPSP